MVEGLFVLGAALGLTLLALLVLTVSGARFQIWPLPIAFSARSMIFWSLFRGLNVLTAAMVVLDFASLREGPGLIRFLAGVAALGALLFFLYAGVRLGRDKLYGGQSGLETGGIYRFTRNPQYAAAMPGFIGAAVAAWSFPAFVLAALIASVYMMMAIAEEPWLERMYGSAYERYRARVPRFYNWRAVRALVQSELARARL